MKEAKQELAMEYTGARKTISSISRKQLDLNHMQEADRAKDLHIELERHKVDPSDERNMRKSLDKRIAFSK